MFFDCLDTALNAANFFKILAEPAAVARAESVLEPDCIRRDRVE
jgi:hypothetical protein